MKRPGRARSAEGGLTSGVVTGAVTIQVAVSGSAQELDIHQQKFDLYTEEHPNVTIEPVDIGTERFQKLMTLIGSGTAPISSISTSGAIRWPTGRC